MPNQYQLSFLFAFFANLALLYALKTYVQDKLRAAGYDISRLILIGLPKNDIDEPMVVTTTSSTVSAAFPYTQVGALLLAVVTSALLYVRFGAKSKCQLRFDRSALTSLTMSLVTRQSASRCLTPRSGRSSRSRRRSSFLRTRPCS